MSSNRSARSLALVCALLATVGLAVSFAPAGAQASALTVTASALQTPQGSTGEQPVSALAVRNLSGSTDNWSHYVEFKGR